MDRSGSGVKKAVRFSSPFETELEPPGISGTIRRNSSAEKSTAGAGGKDSWDAFDAKMSKSTKIRPKVIENQFLELSETQNKSLNLEAEDFSNLSFQDPKDLIDRDENERLQFMNSNVSFSEGIEQVEAPSLLSITNYFQQGSSFPVPYVGNDSTMMFGARESLAGISYSDVNTITKRRTSSQPSITKRNSSSASKRSSVSSGIGVPVVAEDGKPDLSRNNSLAQFFLGPQSNGMDRNDILEYVIDYCKRRASVSFSDMSDMENSPPTNVGNNSNKCSEKYDSGVVFANAEKTVIQRAAAKKPSNVEVVHQNVYKVPDSSTPRNALQFSPPQKDEKEESVMLAEGRSLKNNGSLLDVSEVGSIDGFEKFKKNLNHNHNHNARKGEDKYRGKLQHHAEFERKRLYVDERNSHPGLAPKGLEGPGCTASLERPNKMMMNKCASPPEKLVCSKKTTINDKCQSPVMVQTSRNSGGQYHSTPVTSESYISKLVTATQARGEHPKPSKLVDIQVKNENSEKQKRQKIEHPNSNDSSSSRSSQQGTSYSNSNKAALQDDRSELKNEGISGNLHDKQSDIPFCVKRPTSISTDLSSKVLKPSNVLPEGLSILPVIHSGLQQHFSGGQQCSCPHQCGQQPSPMGMATGHGPIVIHIHLPCTVSSSGTVVHPVPTSTDHQK